jgi:hypothetical protein
VTLFGGDIKDFPSDFTDLRTIGHAHIQTLNHDLNAITDTFQYDLSYSKPLDIYLMGFALVATGTMTVSAGKYTLCTKSQDGSRLYVDGALIVDNGGIHTPKQVCVVLRAIKPPAQWYYWLISSNHCEQVCQTTPLTAGMHTVVVHFFVKSKKFKDFDIPYGGAALLAVELDSQLLCPNGDGLVSGC